MDCLNAARRIPRPAGQNAGLRDDVLGRDPKFSHYKSLREFALRALFLIHQWVKIFPVFRIKALGVASGVRLNIASRVRERFSRRKRACTFIWRIWEGRGFEPCH
jgi:hypothetical protein